MEKAFEIQKKARDNVKALQTYMTDLQNWEAEMKRKEAALNGEFEQDLPPVRSKIKKEKPVVPKKKPEKKIRGSDYTAWDKYDVDKACEEVDMADVGPVSLDSKKSQQAKLEKLKEEAQYEKERGNTFVKQEKWDEAIACYNRAIDLVKDDAIYFANRGLCHLKKDSLHQAESDCTEALRLDPTYVKALQRRATARERLGSLRSASHDLNEVLKLEPHNTAARKQLDAIKMRMGTKGAKSKSSPTTTPTAESKPLFKSKPQPKIVELPPEPVTPAADDWRKGVGENIMVIKPVKKPPHLRSKRALKSIPIQEVLLGEKTPEKPPTRLKIIEIEDNMALGDSNNNDSNKIDETPAQRVDIKGGGDKVIASPESMKLITDTIVTEKEKRNFVPPVNSVQFMSEWKYLKDQWDAKCQYWSLIEPSKIPSIFANALESSILSDVIHMLEAFPAQFSGKVTAYLLALTTVQRFSALAMFLSHTDKQKLMKVLEYCKTSENTTDEVIADLKNKYEL
ncbi:RNA polymerase II-associated protein 3 isoform X2 [Helicoverpa armigera]|uniref:RNA polymerase II-associated protein 3 isoform X2 n=2 Tax=Helicoverpa armigera TaxID=29058 RepID=UPI0021125435|nr:RNA polymerase II-associated protein 3 isoform X1 [Helicoverpa armigera]